LLNSGAEVGVSHVHDAHEGVLTGGLQSEMTGLALILQDEFQGDSVSGSTVERVLPGLRQEEFHRVIAVEVL